MIELSRWLNVWFEACINSTCNCLWLERFYIQMLFRLNWNSVVRRRAFVKFTFCSKPSWISTMNWFAIQIMGYTWKLHYFQSWMVSKLSFVKFSLDLFEAMKAMLKMKKTLFRNCFISLIEICFCLVQFFFFQIAVSELRALFSMVY